MTPDRCDGIVLAAGAGTRYGMPKVLAEDGAWLRSAVRALREGGCARVYVVLGATGPAQRVDDSATPQWLISRNPRIPVPSGAYPVWASDWAIGVSASMRAGLAAAAAHPRVVGLGSNSTPEYRETGFSSADGCAATRIIGTETTVTGITGLGITAAGNKGVVNEWDSAPPEFVAIMPVDTPDVGGAVVERVLTAARGSSGAVARAVFQERPGHPVILGRSHWAGAAAEAEGNSGAGTYLKHRADMVCVTCDDLATGLDQDYPGGIAR
ncbi:nucleotidyltransferase family protein [Nocardia jejuensis]|uniref:nucleotidyltransferase family protein n=1 Tax=Nocardia jejuensis TaxID=328049 RepID=UPI0008348C2C|nr:NTP transferase domain-containing protein [Nocardia jejuensis]